MQALCCARSALEEVLQNKPVSKPKNYHLTVEHKKLLPNYTQLTITITIEPNTHELLSLSSGVFHE